MNPHLVYAVLNILAAVAAAALILANIRLRKAAKELCALCERSSAAAYRKGIEAERFRQGRPIEERERQAYIQGLKDARAALEEEFLKSKQPG